jgi:hypothetical protein
MRYCEVVLLSICLPIQLSDEGRWRGMFGKVEVVTLRLPQFMPSKGGQEDVNVK